MSVATLQLVSNAGQPLDVGSRLTFHNGERHSECSIYHINPRSDSVGIEGRLEGNLHWSTGARADQLGAHWEDKSMAS